MTLFERLLFMPFLFDADEGGGGGTPSESAAAHDAALDRQSDVESDEDGAGELDDIDLDDFDQERAMKTIKNLRQVEKDLKKELKDAQPLVKKAREAEEASKDEKTKLTEAKEEAAREAAEAKAEVIRLRMAIKYSLEEEDLDLLGTGDEEAIENRAKRLADRGKGQEPKNNSRTPRERLRPGAVPSSEPEETNPDSLAADLPRLY